MDDKKQVMNRPFGSISEKTSIEELYNQSMVYTTEQHNIVTDLRWRYEVFLLCRLLFSMSKSALCY